MINVNDLSRLNDELRREIENKIRAIWKDKDVNEIMVNIEQTLRYSHLLTVYRLVHDEIENDIDIAILRSLLKAKKDNYKAQLKLCLTWNRIDIAKNFIFTDEKIWQVCCLHIVSQSHVLLTYVSKLINIFFYEIKISPSFMPQYYMFKIFFFNFYWYVFGQI